VFGQRTGAAAAADAATMAEVPRVDPVQIRAAAEELAAPFAPGPGEDPYRLHEELQATMQSLVGIFRTEADLHEAIGRLAGLYARWPSVRVAGGRAYNPGWGLVHELRNMLIVSEAIARSARQRKESRGAHSRLDFPEPSRTWARKNSVVRRVGETMEVATSPLPRLPDDLRKLIATE
jgi:succinate dehydrogenase / fumarate reductase flavoprotein subunit